MLPFESEQELRAQIASLESKLLAREKTISVLARRVEESVSTSTSSFAVFEQNIVLENAVATKTHELVRQQKELREALESLQFTQVQLLQAQKLEAIGALAAGVAHEINTPTQYATDNVRFLKDAFCDFVKIAERYKALGSLTNGVEESELENIDYLTQEIPRAIQETLEGLSRITSIVRAMKDFSHPSVGEIQEIDLHALIQTTVTVARNEWRYVAELVTEFDDEMPPVPCLRDEVGQVLLNLLVNAAHAIADANVESSGQKGTISVSTNVLGEFAQIKIRDTGGGIPISVRHRIFEPFFTTKAVGRGTGQGLAITRSVVVDKHHGQIDFETKLGVGTTFRILLPLKAAVKASRNPSRGP